MAASAGAEEGDGKDDAEEWVEVSEAEGTGAAAGGEAEAAADAALAVSFRLSEQQASLLQKAREQAHSLVLQELHGGMW
jgi:hypothetical protein